MNFKITNINKDKELSVTQNTADAETIWIGRWPNTWFSLYTNKVISLGQAYDLRGRKILELRKPCYHGTIMPVICTHYTTNFY